MAPNLYKQKAYDCWETSTKIHPGCVTNAFPRLWPACWGNPSYGVNQLRGSRTSKCYRESKMSSRSQNLHQATRLWGIPTATSPKNTHVCPLRKPGKGLLQTVPAFPTTTYRVNPLNVAGTPSLAFSWEFLPSPPQTQMLVSMPEELKPKRRLREILPSFLKQLSEI